MVQLKIVEKNEYEYVLEGLDGKIYKFNLEFFDIKEDIEVGNLIYVNEELLNKKYEGYSLFYTFGALENKYGKENIELTDIDVIKVVRDGIEIYLKRLYG